MKFVDRHDAGRKVAAQLRYLARDQPIVIALPRGGVPIGVEVARSLGAQLDILAVRKLGAPGDPELGVGAVAEDGTGVLDPGSVGMLGMTEFALNETLEHESRELRRRVERYRDGRPPTDVDGRTVIVVDDGLATGLSDLAAVRALRKRGARQIVVAAPVGSREAVRMLAREADRVICLMVPERLYGIGVWYRDFGAVSDEQVLALLAEVGGDRAASPASAGPGHDEPLRPAGAPSVGEALSFDLQGVELAGDLTVPGSPSGLVLFAHGSGSSRMSPRNRAVAQTLNDAGVATLLMDLLDEQEARRRELVFDVALLARRLAAVTRWVRSHPRLRSLPIGYFGASTGAAAALRAAAELGDAVGAVVSRGGRPDLAGDRLAGVVSPTLLIVGGLDRQVLALNRDAASSLRCVHELVVVEGAGHLFEEPGTLERVAELATEWFRRYLASGRDRTLAGAA